MPYLLAPTPLPLEPARLPLPQALAFWLANPLLVAAHPALVAQRTSEYPTLPRGRQSQLLQALKQRRGVLRNTTPVVGQFLDQRELTQLLAAHCELCDEPEYRAARAFAFGLHPAERAWYAAFVRGVFRAREAALSTQRAA